VNRKFDLAHGIAAAAVAIFAGVPAMAVEAPPRALSPRMVTAEASGNRIHRPNLHPTPECPLPSAAPDEQLIALGTYDGEAVSSSWVGSPDWVTYVNDIVIEPGKRPLYLLLTSYDPVIWRFTGATKRVKRVVVTSYKKARRTEGATGEPAPTYQYGEPTPAQAWRIISASGVIGLPAEKVVIAPTHCPKHFSSTGAAEAAFASAREALGRPLDEVFARYSAQRVWLPSGKMAEARSGSAQRPAGFDEAVWNDAVRYYPGGLVFIRPEEIVAAVPVAEYEVLPSQMGISQLIGAGAIEPLDTGEYRLLRSIPHLPPGMGGSHSIKLILAKGVPRPPGDPVHSCIMTEEQERQYRLDRKCPDGD
jgi:hypothetical protein